MHKVSRQENEGGEGFFATGLKGWGLLFSKLKGKPKEQTEQKTDQTNSKPQQPEQQSV